MTVTSFACLGLAQELLRALGEEGYDAPTPIQAAAIPALLDGEDLLGIAQTGTGKTAAFMLPILHKLGRTGPATSGRPLVLVLAPTRELAMQIADSARVYGRHTRMRTEVLLGGVNARPQVAALRRGCEILVATPGRLLDLMSQRHLSLEDVGILVLDEADRMLDMGFIPDVRRIIRALPAERQSMLFSATMPDDVARLAGDMLQSPRRIDIAPEQMTVERIVQSVHFVSQAAKNTLLTDLLADASLARVIVFTRTKHRANRVTRTLEQAGISAGAIHGNKSQGAREKALADFRAGRARVLVATDIAARGIDVDGVTHVINYELPNIPESYVHRIGRTARAGNDGVAIAMCAPEEQGWLKDIEKLTGARMAVAGGTPMANPPKPKAPGRQGRPQGGEQGKPQARPQGKERREAGEGNRNRNRNRNRRRAA